MKDYNYRLEVIAENYLQHLDGERLVAELKQLEETISHESNDENYWLCFRAEGGNLLWSVNNVKAALDYPKNKLYLEETLKGKLEIE